MTHRRDRALLLGKFLRDTQPTRYPMPNRFYSAFDAALLEPSEARAPREPGDPRTAFAVDRDRVIFSSVFRRLQSKTQVFQSGEYDFYRTRLTHSIEVARIGRSLAEALNAAHPAGGDAWIDADLVEAVGLAHDLGHPPFGHIGERRLHALMEPWGGFEGNAQTLRLLAARFYERRAGAVGMNPTRAFLDGVLKYKSLRREELAAAAAENPSAPRAVDNHFLYDDQEPLRDFALGGPEAAAAAREAGDLNDCKSIECQLMDWADDTAYSLHDIVDGAQARYLTTESIERWAESCGAFTPERQHLLDKLLDALAHDRLEPLLNARIGTFIRAARLVPREHPLAARTQRYAWRLEIKPEVLAEAEFYKKIAFGLIFKSPSIQQIEFKGGFILDRLFGALNEHYLDTETPRPLALLPARWDTLLRGEPSTPARARLVCDFIADLTDGAAVRLYRRLFDPAFGSITDLV